MAGGEPIYAVDVSVWPRCDAETSPERALYYHASRHSAGQPIVAGWAYSWIAQVGFARESWTAPLRVRRLRPQENANTVAAEQIATLVPHLPTTGPLPWFLFDAGYDPVQLTQALGDTRAAILVRLRSGRCFYADPTTQPRTGRPRRHGHKFVCDAPQTWPAPADDLTVEDEQYGTVRVRAWTGLHPKTHGQHAQRDARGRRPIVRGTLCSSRSVVCPSIPASRKRSGSGGIRPKMPTSLPNLDRAWRAYVRRFDVEHTFRFLKQTLNWTLPAGAPPRTSRSLDLAGGAGLHSVAPRPPARGRPAAALAASPAGGQTHPGHASNGRFRRFCSRLPILACAPKPCGRSPGRPKGKRSGARRAIQPSPRPPGATQAA